ncbi:HdeD family acid-resistance protein [Primorskyibacter sp. S87]|uniref:HdeD family acid-resistance protein n=1 Tax=Primorskyibacter sp. S87 TaxID=3415126 RepID=UPI003C7C6ECA
MTKDDKDLQQSWGWFLALGILLCIAGGSAWLAPVMTGFVLEQVIGAALLVAGVFGLVQVFMTGEGWNARMTYLILGGFNALAGLALLFHPFDGLLAITLVLIVAFFVNGLIRIAVGVMARPESGSGWMIFAGALSVLLSGYLMMLYPEISSVLTGVVAGCLLVSEGAGYIRFAYGLKSGQSMQP